MVLCLLSIIRKTYVDAMISMEQKCRASTEWNALVCRTEDDVELWDAGLSCGGSFEGGGYGGCIGGAEGVESSAVSD